MATVTNWIDHLSAEEVVGAVYPGAGSAETLLVIAGIVIWIGWHVLAGNQESEELSKLAKSFGMKIIATRRLQKTITSNRFVDTLLPLSDIYDLYTQSDFIAVTCPLTPMTKQMISFNEFSLMKKTAYIINIARGGIINDKALIDALDHHKIFGAALDVFTHEPLEKDHPYFKYDNVFLSPHISGNFPEYQTDMIQQFIDHLICFLNGKALKNRICKKRLY